MASEREKLMRLTREKVVEWQSMGGSERVTTVLDYSSRKGKDNW